LGTPFPGVPAGNDPWLYTPGYLLNPFLLLKITLFNTDEKESGVV